MEASAVNNAVKNSTDKSMAIPKTMEASFTHLFLNVTVMTLGQILVVPVALLVVYICIGIGSIRRQFRDLVWSPFVRPPSRVQRLTRIPLLLTA